MNEIWRQIKDYEGIYEVSNLGNIRTIRTGIIRVCQLHKYGYITVRLSKNGKVKKVLVHRLVAQAFTHTVENKPYITHIDGDRQNNIVANLKWTNASESTNQALKTGAKIPPRGEDNGHAKLTKTDVLEIRQLCEQELTQKEICEIYGVDQTQVSRINTRKTWRWL